ncbi:MAG: HU family DNA-binding protein [Thermoguttaceae bacterium]|jgi:nucleoid DNA-binding protein
MEDQKPAESKKPMTKTEILTSLAESSELTKQQVARVFDELAKLIAANLAVEGPGVFTVPGMMKISVVRKPATEARTGINPFTKEETVFKAKPARNVVKVTALKGLKDLV